MPQAQGQIEAVEVRGEGKWRLVTIAGNKYSCWDNKVFPQLYPGNVITYEFKPVEKDGRTYFNLMGILPPGTAPSAPEAPPQVGGHPVTGSPTPPPSKYGRSREERTEIILQHESTDSTSIHQIAVTSVMFLWDKRLILDDPQSVEDPVQFFLEAVEKVAERLTTDVMRQARRLAIELVTQLDWDQSPGTPEERGEVS